MLKHRIITAIILIAITLAVLFYLPPQGFCLLLGVVTLGGAWEWSNLMGIKKRSARLLYVTIMAIILFSALFIPIPFILFVAFIWWLIATVLIVLYPRTAGFWGKGYLWRGLMGIFVLLPCWTALNYIRNQTDGVSALLFLFVLIWGADSAAYFTGKKWGKNKLAPMVSPGKSIQGVVGAVIFAILLTMLILFIGKVSQGWFWAITLSVLTVLFSIVGDLFESMLKRQVGVKDSGQLLPGHGGLLDRIDSLTAAAPIFAFTALLLGTYL